MSEGGPGSSGSRRTVYVALVGNLLIAISKFVAAAVTGSSAMFSEGVHSLVDTGDQMLLLYGLHRASQPPDAEHPLGHGRELYFWSFIVAVLIFGLGAGLSFYEGVAHILAPEPVRNIFVSYIVLGLAALFEGYSWSVALKEIGKEKGRLGYIEAARKSKDPTIFTVFLEDSAALLGIGLAFLGITASYWWSVPALDGAASIGIAVILAATAAFLARESKGLLIGEPASARIQSAIMDAARKDPAVEHANGVLTVHLAPDQVMAALSAAFKDTVTAPEIEACVQRIESRLKAQHPEITTLFVKPQSQETWEELRRDRQKRRRGSSG